jgi:hypothetical protein
MAEGRTLPWWCLSAKLPGSYLAEEVYRPAVLDIWVLGVNVGERDSKPEGLAACLVVSSAVCNLGKLFRARLSSPSWFQVCHPGPGTYIITNNSVLLTHEVQVLSCFCLAVRCQASFRCEVTQELLPLGEQLTRDFPG